MSRFTRAFDIAAQHQVAWENIAYSKGRTGAKVPLFYLWVRKALPAGCFISLISCSKCDGIVKSRNQTAKKKDPDARRANPEE